jgi:hypothetical protein
MVPSAEQIAFDVAVKSRHNFDYRGIADLEELRQRDSSLSTFIDKLVEIRQSFNGALAVEGHNITGDARTRRSTLTSSILTGRMRWRSKTRTTRSSVSPFHSSSTW